MKVAPAVSAGGGAVGTAARYIQGIRRARRPPSRASRSIPRTGTCDLCQNYRERLAFTRLLSTLQVLVEDLFNGGGVGGEVGAVADAG